MIGAPTYPRTDREDKEPTWQRIFIRIAIVAAVPLLLWIANQPIVGTAAVASGGVLVLATRRGLTLVQCLRDCGGFRVEVGSNVHVCVARPGVCTPG